jgi:hypothetical protein
MKKPGQFWMAAAIALPVHLAGDDYLQRHFDYPQENIVLQKIERDLFDPFDLLVSFKMNPCVSNWTDSARIERLKVEAHRVGQVLSWIDRES